MIKSKSFYKINFPVWEENVYNETYTTTVVYAQRKINAKQAKEHIETRSNSR